jgi:hypothetical protein
MSLAQILKLSPFSFFRLSKIDFTSQGAKLNRWFLRLFATEDEYIWGGGEQYSYFNLR